MECFKIIKPIRDLIMSYTFTGWKLCVNATRLNQLIWGEKALILVNDTLKIYFDLLLRYPWSQKKNDDCLLYTSRCV